MVWRSGDQGSHPTMVRGPQHNFSEVFISVFQFSISKPESNTMRVFLLLSNALGAILGFFMDFCHIIEDTSANFRERHLWSSFKPGGQLLSLPFLVTRQSPNSPVCPGTVSCHTSPAVWITVCANSHLLLRPMMSLQALTQSLWVSALLLCTGDS